MIDFNIDVDTSALEKSLSRIDEGIRGKAAEEMLVRGGQVFVKHAKINAKGKLRHLTGRLLNSIDTYNPSPSQIEIGSKGVIYAAIHEFGGTIYAKRAKALHWVDDDGNEYFAKSVRIPERSYLRPAFDENKAEALRAMEHFLKGFLA